MAFNTYTKVWKVLSRNKALTIRWKRKLPLEATNKALSDAMQADKYPRIRNSATQRANAEIIFRQTKFSRICIIRRVYRSGCPWPRPAKRLVTSSCHLCTIQATRIILPPKLCILPEFLEPLTNFQTYRMPVVSCQILLIPSPFLVF
jgi:hypothetical protein